jgi:hypothetical protein
LIEGWASDAGGLNHMAASLGLGGGITDPVLLRSDLELRFTEEGQMASRWSPLNGYIPDDTLIYVPFEIWDIERNIQLCVGIADNNFHPTTGKNFGIYDPELMTLQNDWVITLHTDYATSGDSIHSLFDNLNSGWLFFFSRESKYSIGDILRFYNFNPINPDIEEFTFTTPAVNTSLSKSELKKQTESGQHFITFTHLPEKDAVIRIFSLGGQLIRKINHDNGTPFEYWDLKNRFGKYVASGMYIAHIDVKGVGEKILKIAAMVPG